ncbi:MAG: SusC/RagA family TonB-linked outer membrane protein, partial [Dysgonamonadaceae bacterium]|nr:SusC/RagA family TonB-linked outer membrane protein [Dysgonamonadaceae bacterium]
MKRKLKFPSREWFSTFVRKNHATCLVLTVFLSCSLVALAQTREVTGKVSDNIGEAIIGANVVVKGSTVGTATNTDGTFSLRTEPNVTLVVSYLGYKTQELAVGNRTNLNIILEEDSQSLDEVTVVAVGYGVARKSDLTGAITSVSAKDLRRGVISSAEQLLQGKIAGLAVINSNGGDPTSSPMMRLRGGTSLTASSAPLVVVDGIPGVDINTVQPTEIVSIDVLKDASAAAIYGSRGANGVIMVTTNRKEGGRKLSYNGFAAVGRAKNLDVLSSSEWRAWEAKNGSANWQDMDYGANTNWQEELQQTAITQSHNISFSQGSALSGFQASVTYLQNQGTMKNSKLDRLTGSLNAYATGLNDKLRLELGVHTTIDKTDDVDGGILRSSYRNNPTIPVFDKDGNYTNKGWKEHPNAYGTNSSNVMESLAARQDEGSRKRLLGYGKIELDIVDGLKGVANLSYEYGNSQDYQYAFSGFGYPPSESNSASRSLGETTRRQLETYLNYNKIIDGRHSIAGMAGYSYLYEVNEGFGARRSKFETDAFLWNNLGTGTNFLQGDVSSYKNDSKLISAFARVNYGFDNKYLFTATIRSDGSSKFGENHKWGYFPSISAAWRITEESFMDGASDWLQSLKIRVGYGVTGNQNGLSPYQSLPTVSAFGGGESFFDVVSGTFKPSYGFSRNANPDLKWESTAQTNIGFDFSIFERITGTLDWYRKLTSDLLYTYQVATPPYLYRTMLANVGDLSNTGVELTLNANILKSKDLTFDANLTLAHNKQVVEKLSNDQFQLANGKIYTGSLQGLAGLDVRTQVVAEGYPVGTFIGLKSKGIVDGKFDIPRDDEGRPLTTFQDDAVYPILGDAQPDMTFGLGFDLRYRNIDFNLATYGMLGQKVLNALAAELAGKSWT